MLSTILRPQKRSAISRAMVSLIKENTISEIEIQFFTLYSSRFRKGGYIIQGDFPELGTLQGRGQTLFEALLRLREKLERQKFILAVWGSKCSVWPSGMEADMGGGFEAVDRASDPYISKSIFDPIPLGEAVTTGEQHEWMRSNITKR